MIKIVVKLSEQEYSDNLLLFFINRIFFKIISNSLLCFIIVSIIISIIYSNVLEMKIIIVWFILWIFYRILIPHIIKRRAKIIYKNTLFLQNEMYFEFLENTIIWTTSNGVQQTKLSNMHQINTTKKALILAFSPYQILPIPYHNISLSQWDQIIKIIKLVYHKKFNITYYYKYLK